MIPEAQIDTGAAAIEEHLRAAGLPDLAADHALIRALARAALEGVARDGWHFTPDPTPETP